MPSCVWCGRAPYRVLQSPGEVAERIDRARDKHTIVFFDLADQAAKPDGDQIGLAIEHISAVERSDDDPCTCGPNDCCSACRRPR